MNKVKTTDTHNSINVLLLRQPTLLQFNIILEMLRLTVALIITRMRLYIVLVEPEHRSDKTNTGINSPVHIESYSLCTQEDSSRALIIIYGII